MANRLRGVLAAARKLAAPLQSVGRAASQVLSDEDRVNAEVLRRLSERSRIVFGQDSGKPAAEPAALTGESGVTVKEYAIPLVRSAKPHQVRIRLSIPDVPAAARNAGFAEHPRDPATGLGGNIVVAVGEFGVMQSDDTGRSWLIQSVDLPLRPLHCFTTASGHHIIATQVEILDDGARTRSLIGRFDADWRLTGPPHETAVPWHGSASIGESAGTLMLAEYPDNGLNYGRAPENLAPIQRIATPSRVWRSRDDGQSWDVVMSVPSSQARHLHTVQPDPERPGVWWASSGDRSEEVFIWRTDDDGDTWRDVTVVDPKVALNESFAHRARAVQRMTDLVFQDGKMIWGSDDWLGDVRRYGREEGPRVGSRVYHAPVDDLADIQEAGYCGPPIRSMVDVGPAWILITEAKSPQATLRPEAHLMFKDDLSKVHSLIQIDNYRQQGTGLSYSRASRAATSDGVFFTYRSPGDAFISPTAILRWEIAFE